MVTSRVDRQRLLYKPDARLRIVLAEAVVHHRLGGDVIATEQLSRLIDVARLPTVELGIIPLDTDMTSRYGASFDLYERLNGEDESVVLIELEAGEVYETEPDRVARYARRHDIYWSAARKNDAAIQRIERVREDLDRRIFRPGT